MSEANGVPSSFVGLDEARLGGDKKTAWIEVPSERIAAGLTKPSTQLPLISTDTRTLGVSRQYTEDISLSAKSEAALMGFDEATGQVYDFAVYMAHTLHAFGGFSMSVDDFQRMRGIKDRKQAKDQLMHGLSNLGEVWVEYKPLKPLKKKGRMSEADRQYDILSHVGRFRIIENVPKIDNTGTIPIVFSKLYSPVLSAVTPMPYHEVLLRLNTNTNRHSYKMGRKIFEHKYIEVKHREHGTDGYGYASENVLKVTTLLAACGLKTYEDASPSIRHAYRAKVIVPFERDLNALSEAFTWEYRLGGQPLPSGFTVTPQNFKDLTVLFHFIDYPSQAERLARIEARRQADFQRRVAYAKRAEAAKGEVIEVEAKEVKP